MIKDTNKKCQEDIGKTFLDSINPLLQLIILNLMLSDKKKLLGGKFLHPESIIWLCLAKQIKPNNKIIPDG